MTINVNKKLEMNDSTLHVEQAGTADYPIIESVSKHWREIAKNKIKWTNKLDEPKAYEQLEDCKSISKAIAFNCRKFQVNPDELIKKGKELYVCKDKSGEIYGIALVIHKSSAVFGHLLVTHPINIRCKANMKEEKKVEGVGRAFLSFLGRESKQRKINSVFLYPFPSAESFYLKFGFDFQPSQSPRMMGKVLHSSEEQRSKL